MRKTVLTYGYSRKNYSKQVTKQMDTWLDATGNLRNVCSHHNKLIGKTSSIVLSEFDEIEDKQTGAVECLKCIGQSFQREHDCRKSCLK